MIAATGIWSFVLLSRDSSWLPWLRWVVLVGSLLGAALLVVSAGAWRRFAVVGLLVGSLTALSGTAAWTVATAATAHSGSIPTSGPSGSSAAGGFGGADARGRHRRHKARRLGDRGRNHRRRAGPLGHG